MNGNLWKQIEEFYKNKFGITPEVTNLMSKIDILRLCVNGASNKQISSFLDVDTETIVAVLRDTLGFNGFLEEPEYSPIKMYEKGLLDPNSTDYSICKKYEELEGILDEKWV